MYFLMNLIVGSFSLKTSLCAGTRFNWTSLQNDGFVCWSSRENQCPFCLWTFVDEATWSPRSKVKNFILSTIIVVIIWWKRLFDWPRLIDTLRISTSSLLSDPGTYHCVFSLFSVRASLYTKSWLPYDDSPLCKMKHYLAHSKLIIWYITLMQKSTGQRFAVDT